MPPSDEKAKRRKEKNQNIGRSFAATKKRRDGLRKRIFEIKFVENKLDDDFLHKITMTFLEGKWFCNYLKGSALLWEDAASDLTEVLVKVFNPITKKCDIIEKRKLEFIGSQVKQSLVAKMRQDIINLSKAKAKGRKVGRIRHISELTMIPLKQPNITYKIMDRKHVRIQNIGVGRVNGLEQILDLPSYELGEAKLIKRVTGYYINILVYTDKEPLGTEEEIAMDMGIKQPLTLTLMTKEGSTEVLVEQSPPDVMVPKPKMVKKHHKSFSRKKRGSKNSKKALKALTRTYQKWKNQKNDKVNKLIHQLKKHKLVVTQDDYIAGWKHLWGKKLDSVNLGRIKSMMKNLETSVFINRFEPTTKECPICLKRLDLTLEERFFICLCGLHLPRDVKSAELMLCLGKYAKYILGQNTWGPCTVEERESAYRRFWRLENLSVEAGDLPQNAVYRRLRTRGAQPDASDFSPR